MVISGKIEITEEKARKLKPIFESILSRKYGKQITLVNMSMGKIKIEN
ncbi:MAG: hypothetical protein ACI35R_13255 [Bacillus sp. (in: firmicutes)]